MPAFIVLVLVAIGALAVLSFALHFLFSLPVLLVGAVALVAWMRFRPRHSHR
jgi:hypothetical protein